MEGVPYVYGGDSPSGFDCSGLVYWAALQIGVSSMPRDTYEMLAQGVSSGLLTPVSTPSYGDLAFFGSGHVEFYVKPGETFGAQQPGTTVGYHSYNGYYEPTEYYAIN
jgi:cell wall-associated NlpC family hydrolase